MILNPQADFAEKIKELRKMYKVSQKELAQAISKKSDIIWRYERGESVISINVMLDIMDYFVLKYIRADFQIIFKYKAP